PNNIRDKVFQLAAAEFAVIQRVSSRRKQTKAGIEISTSTNPPEVIITEKCDGHRPRLQKTKRRRQRGALISCLVFDQLFFAASRKCLTRSCALLISLN